MPSQDPINDIYVYLKIRRDCAGCSRILYISFIGSLKARFVTERSAACSCRAFRVQHHILTALGVAAFYIYRVLELGAAAFFTLSNSVSIPINDM